jgi:hypothetical protein
MKYITSFVASRPQVTKQMHSFGEKRWGVGIGDDFSQCIRPKPRIVGDFTKVSRWAAIVKDARNAVRYGVVI